MRGRFAVPACLQCMIHASSALLCSNAAGLISPEVAAVQGMHAEQVASKKQLLQEAAEADEMFDLLLLHKDKLSPADQVVAPLVCITIDATWVVPSCQLCTCLLQTRAQMLALLAVTPIYETNGSIESLHSCICYTDTHRCLLDHNRMGHLDWGIVGATRRSSRCGRGICGRSGGWKAVHRCLNATTGTSDPC